MYVQCSSVYQTSNKTVSFNRKLVESYRDPKTKKPRNRTVKKLEQLPILERARLIYQYGGQKHLRSEEWSALNDAGDFNDVQTDLKVGDVYSGAGSAVANHHLDKSGLHSVLSSNLSKGTTKVIRELMLHQLLNHSSKSHFVKARKSEYLCGLEGKSSLSETTLYRAMDELESQFMNIKKQINILEQRKNPILLYDLSNSYFCGKKAELGGYGQSKEKRHDRYIVTYGLVTDQSGVPLDIKVWKGGTADAKTVVGQFTDWQNRYQAEKGIWIADRGMSSEDNTTQVTEMGLDYITGVPGSTQIALLKEQAETTPGLFDLQDLAEFKHNGRRHVLCKHESKGYRREVKYAENRRKAYQKLLKIQGSPQNKNKEKLYHRAMKVLEQYSQTPFWKIEVSPLLVNTKESEVRYQLTFKLDRKQVNLYNRIGHYYLLQTSLSKQAHPAQQVQQDYKGLHRVERCFRELKSALNIRPIRHWKEKRIKAHIYISYLSLWLLKHIELQWRRKEIFTDVKTALSSWNENLKLCQLLDKNDCLVSLRWNQGENASEALQGIKSYGEYDAIKLFI